jgi:hypothetical protein
MTDIRVVSLLDTPVDEFLAELRPHLYRKFNATSDAELHENYSASTPWSLLQMIESGNIDTYQMVYIDGEFWGSSGGRLLTKDNIYQAGFRAISMTHEIQYSGLGTLPYMNAICTKHQIERARLLEANQVWLSFNQHNTKLFELFNKYHTKRKFMGVDELMKDFVPQEKPIMFNNTLQWVTIMDLK